MPSEHSVSACGNGRPAGRPAECGKPPSWPGVFLTRLRSSRWRSCEQAFCFFTLGPGTAALPDDFDAAAAAGQVQRDIPGLLDVFEADNPGMHTSDTVDVNFVLSGEVDVELDDGVEVHLKAGDVLVQHGTRHAWRNSPTEPCVLVVAVTGARRA